MENFLNWISSNGDTVSGYVILIVVVVVFILAIWSGKLVTGKAHDQTTQALTACLHKLEEKP